MTHHQSLKLLNSDCSDTVKKGKAVKFKVKKGKAVNKMVMA
jgi:hypothetical protein